MIKSVVANVSAGKAKALRIISCEDFCKLLRVSCESSDLAVMAGRFIGAEPKDKVNLVTERELARLLNCETQVPGGVQKLGDKNYAARVKRGIEPVSWVLIDADNPEGIPDSWKTLSLQERLELLEPLVPGVSACARVEYRSSSARVVKDGEKPGGATHAWLQISDPTKLEVLRKHVKVQMQLQKLSFPSPRYSKETGEVIAQEARTVIDLAVWVPGRLAFCSKPEVLVDGYKVADANVQIVNPDRGVLDVSGIVLPPKFALNDLREKTGQDFAYSLTGSSLTVKDRSSLTWETPIEIKGVTLPLREIVDQMLPGKKVRCETPFRASSSEAAFIRIMESGMPVLHEVGTSTSYFVAEGESAANDDDSGGPQWVKEFNAKYAWVEGPKSIYRFEFCDFIKQGELTTQHRNDPLIVKADEDKEKRSCRVNAWISHPDRAQYRELVFAPAERAITQKNEINTWKGFAVTPVAGNVDPYKALRDHLFPDLQEQRYLEQWLAHKLKYPGVKMNTALIVWSQLEGVGKNLLFETVSEIIGSAHSCVIGQKDLVGSFNSWAKNRLFVIGDEVLSSGNRQDADRLKGLITGTTLRINEKNQPEYDIANYASFVFLSNHGDAVYLETGNRRFFVSEIRAAPLPPEFYTSYAAWRDDSGLAALHHYMINDVDLRGFDPKAPPPQTVSKSAMVAASRSGLEQWMSDVMEDPVGSFGGTVMTAELLKAAYDRAGGDSHCTLKALVNAAKKAGAQIRPSQVRLPHCPRIGTNFSRHMCLALQNSSTT